MTQQICFDLSIFKLKLVNYNLMFCKMFFVHVNVFCINIFLNY